MEDKCLEELRRMHPNWVSTFELADKVSLPWRSVAAALSRLARKGQADVQVVDVPGAARSKEQQRVFRANLHPVGRVVRF